MSLKKYVWVDTDSGINDIFSLISAFNLMNIEIVGISTVFGKCSVDDNFRVMNNLMSLLNKNINVYKGADRPLINEVVFDGKPIEINLNKNETQTHDSAIDALYKKAKELNGELYIVSIAPLTNIASAIFKYPDIVKYIREIVFGGGSVAYGGSVTSTSEKNCYLDPHAAQSVFKSGVKLSTLGLDVMIRTYLNKEEYDTLKNLKSDIGVLIDRAIVDICKSSKKYSKEDRLNLFDLCPFLYVNNPKLFKGKKAGLYVETRSPLSMGRTVSDIFVHADELFKIKNANIVLSSDRDLIAKDVLDSFNLYR